MDSQRADITRQRFVALHREGTFVMPNAWDLGSAAVLVSLGFPAIATTSSGQAASLGKPDQAVTLEELLAHAAALADAVEVPVNVDAEHGFASDPDGVAATIHAVAQTGAAGCSIEDYDPSTGRIEPIGAATARVAAAARAADKSGLVLTARAENHLYGVNDLDDTITRLRAFRMAGAAVVYAPGLVDRSAIARVVSEVGAPINVLALPEGPTVPELDRLGVRRVSIGGALAFVAYGALADAAREIRDAGTYGWAHGALSQDDRAAAFGRTN